MDDSFLYKRRVGGLIRRCVLDKYKIKILKRYHDSNMGSF